jgi:hypothetical protein
MAAGSGEGGVFELAGARWPDVEQAARRLLVVPVGSLEQHGPHLPLDTDTRIAVAVARRACAGRREPAEACRTGITGSVAGVSSRLVRDKNESRAGHGGRHRAGRERRQRR